VVAEEEVVVEVEGEEESASMETRWRMIADTVMIQATNHQQCV
jgi:hypothetical protein